MILDEKQRTNDLISSDRVEGTAVYGTDGDKIGSVQKLMIRKRGGEVTDAVISVGGFLGMGSQLHFLPWEKLSYDTELDGYKLDVTEEQLREAPTYEANERDREYDPDHRATVYEYWQVAPYW